MPCLLRLRGRHGGRILLHGHKEHAGALRLLPLGCGAGIQRKLQRGAVVQSRQGEIAPARLVIDDAHVPSLGRLRKVHPVDSAGDRELPAIRQRQGVQKLGFCGYRSKGRAIELPHDGPARVLERLPLPARLRVGTAVQPIGAGQIRVLLVRLTQRVQ